MRDRNKFLVLFLAAIFAILFLQVKIEVDVSTAKASSIDGASKFQPVPKMALIVLKGSVNTEEAPKNKITRTLDSQKTPFEPEKKDLLCQLKMARTNVPMHDDVQVFITSMTPFFGNDADNVAWIKSDVCPSGTYSIIHFSNDGKVSQEIDCRNASLTEIAAMSGEQGNIDEVPPKAGETNLAVSGNGYFVLSCPSGGLILTREGKFQQAPEGTLVNSDGCTLLSQNESSFRSSDIDRSGCNSEGDCVATIDPAFDEVYGLEYLSNYSFAAENVGQLSESITKKGDKILRPSFFANALENVHNSERGLTSVSWSNHPYVNFDDLDCQ